MKNSIFISIALLFIVSFVSCSESIKIEETDDGYIISKDQYKLTAQIEDDVYSEQFFVVGCGVNSFAFFDGTIDGITMDTAKSLKEQHGNFLMCINPGSTSAKKAVESYPLIFENTKYLSVLKKVDELKKDMKNPIIEITYSDMDVTGCTRETVEIPLEKVPKKYLLVEDFKIVEENYDL